MPPSLFSIFYESFSPLLRFYESLSPLLSHFIYFLDDKEINICTYKCTGGCQVYLFSEEYLTTVYLTFMNCEIFSSYNVYLSLYITLDEEDKHKRRLDLLKAFINQNLNATFVCKEQDE